MDTNKVKIYIVAVTIFAIGLSIACISLLCIKGSLEREVLIYKTQIKMLQEMLPNVKSDHIKWPNSLENIRKR